MANHPFRLVNVFTRADRSGAAAFSGNPLCVFEAGAGLGTDTMQALARQFNLSETTFILPSERATASVRIFTPTYEMPFAGHPTLGTAHVCRALGLAGDELALEMQAGIIEVIARQDRWTLTAPVPTWREFDAPRSALASALRLTADDIGERPMWLKAGREQLIVPLSSTDAVRRTAPDHSLLEGLSKPGEPCMAYVFALDGQAGQRALARFFFSQGAAMLEDPATGSATANLGGWCLGTDRRLPVELAIAQGEMVQRPSSVYLHVDERRRISVGGDVQEIGRGTITL